jgi:thiamine-phosphate pyrophosphorylase
MFNMFVLTPETNHPHEEQILHALVRAHHSTIHVRKPGFTEEEYRLYLTQYASILSHMVIHEHHSLATEFAVKGIHLKERDRKDVTEIEKNVTLVSTSIHTIEEAKNLTLPFEYIFYSPLFESISKENYGSDTTEEELVEIISSLKQLTTIPIIGLGGIHAGNIARVKECGFDGAAVLGAVWESEEPIVAFENCLRINA